MTMRPLIGSLLAVALQTPAFAQTPVPHVAPHDTPARDADRLAWWRDARFGMFIHWGPVSLRGTEIGWSRGKDVPTAEYDALYKQFSPEKFDADQWVSLAKSAGMKYIVITSKHHDGFCLWDSRQSDYNVMKSPLGRDVDRELSDACRRAGVRFCTYYSILDWRDPNYPLGEAPGGGPKSRPDMDLYVAGMKGQLEELLTRYGPIGLVWFDGQWEAPWSYERGIDLEKFVRSIQPDTIINDRLGPGKAGAPPLGDYATPEQTIGGFNRDRPWETCMTICQQWAWKPGDAMKSLRECLHALVRCVGGDGNLLFNVGPMPDGRIEDRQADRLREMGLWLEKYGESVYATRGGPYMPGANVASTTRGKVVYLHVLAWPEGGLRLPALGARIVSSAVLTGGEATVTQRDDVLLLEVPASDRDPIDTIVKLELDREGFGITPIASDPVK
ncbi:MAG: alpha-L-fucosidase [Phycisphaerales bacterium]|nr:alpha-L-fucosidase [Phycisphaerales bacterium]